jgi:hypothetical protein
MGASVTLQVWVVSSTVALKIQVPARSSSAGLKESPLHPSALRLKSPARKRRIGTSRLVSKFARPGVDRIFGRLEVHPMQRPIRSDRIDLMPSPQELVDPFR